MTALVFESRAYCLHPAPPSGCATMQAPLASTQFFQQCFATIPDSKRTLFNLIQFNQNNTHDPIFAITFKLLTEKLSLTFDSACVAFFKSDPTIVLPYKLLTPSQKEQLVLILQNADGHKLLRSFEQRGGAMSLVCALPAAQHFTCSPSVIIPALYSLLMHSDPSESRMTDVANVVTQRLFGAFVLSRKEYEDIRQQITQLEANRKRLVVEQ